VKSKILEPFTVRRSQFTKNMTDDNEKFLSRWSRLKQETREQPPANPQPAMPTADPGAPPPELPPLDKLTLDSDYRGFFHPKVDENLRRAALRKLFSDPHFNVMDGLDVYIDDYSKPDPLPAAMLAQLKQAQKILDWAKEKKEDQTIAEEPVKAAAAIVPPALAEQTTPPPTAPLVIDQPHGGEQREPQAVSDRKS
jgi:Protein of unknown function (DUF3306)